MQATGTASPTGAAGKPPYFARPLPAVLALVMLLGLGACGKTGFPEPQDPSRSFAWKEVNAKVIGRCLAFTGSFEGAYENFGGLRLEIAGLDGPDECPGCPFVPEETNEISPREAGFDRNSGSIAFSYCPQKARAYRWRLAGISVYSRLPHATMVDRLVVVEP
ncbi:hypothetical protein LJC59_06370 [Desulfovibrio sp. OttesenSCG-928-A18]|nr:hypothetical protein [Desulfovibrio sp. OttesenSCG-928-A18]